MNDWVVAQLADHIIEGWDAGIEKEKNLETNKILTIDDKMEKNSDFSVEQSE